MQANKLTDIAIVERVKKNKLYEKGTIYVQVSACSKKNEKIWKLLGNDGYLETKYAVVSPIIEIIPQYLIYALENGTAEWRHRYVGDAINISMDLFEKLNVIYDPNREAQKFVCELLSPIEKSIDETEREIELNKQVKEFMINGMMV